MTTPEGVRRRGVTDDEVEELDMEEIRKAGERPATPEEVRWFEMLGVSLDESPLVKGGQGRSDQEVEEDAEGLMAAVVFCGLAVLLLCVLALILWVVS